MPVIPGSTGKFAVYKYVQDGNIIYIGQSVNLLERIAQHAAEAKFLDHKDADIYYFFCGSKQEMDGMERALIMKHKPPLNVAHRYDDVKIDMIEPEWKKLDKYKDFDDLRVFERRNLKIQHSDADGQIIETWCWCDLCGKKTKDPVGGVNMDYTPLRLTRNGKIVRGGSNYPFGTITACFDCYQKYLAPLVLQFNALCKKAHATPRLREVDE